MRESPDHLREQFRKRIAENFSSYAEEWVRMEPLALIDHAEQIATVQMLARMLPETANRNEIQYLLRFRNPLKIVCESWNASDIAESGIDDRLGHLLWEIADRKSPEVDYAADLMKPEITSKAHKRSHRNRKER